MLVRTEGGGERAGVVLHVEGEVLHVWVAEGIVRKALNADVQAAAAPELETLANDARVFATLHEGERVRYQDSEGGLAEAMLAEKCRFGALLLAGRREDPRGRVPAHLARAAELGARGARPLCTPD